MTFPPRIKVYELFVSCCPIPINKLFSKLRDKTVTRSTFLMLLLDLAVVYKYYGNSGVSNVILLFIFVINK